MNSGRSLAKSPTRSCELRGYVNEVVNLLLCIYTKHTHSWQRYLGDMRTGINLYADDGEPIAVTQIDLVVNVARAAIMT